jgi:cytochrome P450
MSPAFHRDLVTDMTASITDISREWASSIASRGNARVDLDAAMLGLSLRIVCKTLFAGSLENVDALVSAVTDALQVVVARAQVPMRVPRSWSTPGNRRLASALSVLDRAVDDIIDKRRRRPPGDDVLWSLVIAMDEGIATPREVRDEVVTLIVAGHETVAATLVWTWALLAGHPDVERRLRAEVDEIDEAALDQPDVLDRLPYTRAVIDECLRLYPPAWVITRRCLQPDVLSGCEIAAGATVILSPYVMHRDLRSWPEPRTFRPERFLSGAAPDAGRGPLTYLPFGAGPRLCIGRDLALLEMPLIVASVARRLNFRLERPAATAIDFGVTLRPRGGLRVAAQTRRSEGTYERE